jgi:hypothetical protein
MTGETYEKANPANRLEGQNATNLKLRFLISYAGQQPFEPAQQAIISHWLFWGETKIFIVVLYWEICDCR